MSIAQVGPTNLTTGNTGVLHGLYMGKFTGNIVSVMLYLRTVKG